LKKEKFDQFTYVHESGFIMPIGMKNSINEDDADITKNSLSDESVL
jgi:hypothetical protein